ncbi:MAG TPA: hypothetical protein VNV18_02250 [Stellaceae bacterium]|nr:hypothetical protein [Stellaceae bacterium]
MTGGPRPGRLEIGAILSLGGLGVAAGATIIAFFGIGLSLLVEQPAPPIRPHPAPAAASPLARAARVTGAPPPSVKVSLPPTASAAVAKRAAAGALPAVPVSEPTAKLPNSTIAATSPPPAVAAPSAETKPITVAPPSPPPAETKPASSAPPSTPPAETRPAPAAVVPKPAALPKAAEAAPAVAPGPAMTAPPSAAEIAALLAQGDDAFRSGDLTTARLYYLRAFAAGEGRGALGIGASYDPVFLRRYHLWRARPDPGEARTWYLRARNLGSDAEAETRLARLNARLLR